MTKFKYAAFILTHGRPDNVKTITSLRASGYTGKIYLVLDDTDQTIDQYKINNPDAEIVVFNKQELKGTFDIMDNQDNDKTVIFARNKMYDIASELGYDFFIELDDDYTHFNYRFNNKYEYISSKPIRSLDQIFENMIDYLQSTNVKAIAFAQGGDFIGGKNGQLAEAVTTKRKIMNVYVFETKNPVIFYGRLNDDVNIYIRHGITGDILLTTSQVCVEQGMTQANSGGLTDIYLDMGTYNKSFYSIIASPSSVKINLMGNKHKRLHHIISWNNTVPKIVKQKYKK